MARIMAETPGLDSATPNIVANYTDAGATGTRPAQRDEVYLTLLESIVSQQISVKAADAIFNRLCSLFPANYPTADALLTLSFEELRSVGLSGQKVKYVQSVANFAQFNSLSRAHLDGMTDEEVVQYLTPIKGVGRWTVEMLLMFLLDRPDVFPIDDLIIRQKMIRAYAHRTQGLTGRALYTVLHEIAEPWRPYRTTACRYLWRWKPALQD